MTGRTRIDLLETLPKDGYGAELGVFEGTFSREILRVTRPRWLWLVDTFGGEVWSGDQDGDNIHSANMAEMGIRLAAEFVYLNVRLVKALSYDWLSSLEESVLDWVYIDTDHSLITTMKELFAARRAVRPDGIIAGHDFSPAFPDVPAAVMSFAKTCGLEVELFEGDGLPSYRIVNKKAGAG